MRIHKNILLKLICLVLVTASFSCKKYLDLKPENGIIRQNFWKTKEQIHAAVIGCYASLLGPPTGVNDRALAEYLLWGELRGDMLAPFTGITNEDLDIMNMNILSSNSITNWRSIYRTINYCNTVIDFAPQVLQNDNTLTQQVLDGYIAEAKTLRALMYFYLVRSFRDVPLKLKATSSDEELEQLPKNTDVEILDQIVKDLNDSEPAALTTYGNQASDKGRITRYTVNALQADVYLWMEKYNECITACNKLVNSGRFGLISGSQNAWFSALYVNGNSTESIFEFQFDRQKLNPFYVMFRSRPRFLASGIVMEEIYQQDFIDDTKKDIRGDGAAVRSTDGMIWKYVAIDNNSLRVQEDSYAHWIVYRYADILLMKAEALAQTDKGTEALAIVDQIRLRAAALSQTDLPRSPLPDKETISDFILEERAREFAYEGKRWYDILRHTKRNNYAKLGILLGVIAKSVPPDRQQSAIAKAKDVNSHYFPIYDYEIQTDKNLVQNPFYQ